jgi:ADP-ribose pyrophosphatase YjhB (NUDIX family)
MTWRDTSGKALTDYDRPSVAVDVAVLTVHEGSLAVLVVESERGLALPGTFLHPGETLAAAASRALKTKAAIGGVGFHQLGMYDDPARDDRGWVLSMAHGASAARHRLPDHANLIPIVGESAATDLAFDHNAMVSQAVLDIRARYSNEPDPDRLLADEFTLLELRRLHEAIVGTPLLKDTFRRRVIGRLEGTGERAVTETGRPAELFRLRRAVP